MLGVQSFSMRKFLLSASAVALLVSGPAFAKNDKKPAPAPAPAPTPSVSGPVACALPDLVPGASACSGFFAGNLLGGSGDKLTGQIAGLQSIGFVWDGNWDAITKIDSLNGSQTLDFGKALFGETFIGLHFGGGGKDGVGNGTAFYKIDVSAGLSTGLQQLALKYQGSSGAVLYKTGTSTPGPNPVNAVPEPATWAMMIGGFGLAGSAMRRRNVAKAVLA